MAIVAIEVSLSCASIVLGVDSGTGVGVAGVAAGRTVGATRDVAAGELGGEELGAWERAAREGAIGTSLGMVGDTKSADTKSAAVVGGWVDETVAVVDVGGAVGEDACW